MVRNPGIRKRHEEAQIDWMLQSEIPTPLSFFRFVDASERSRSIQKYSKILMKAIARNSNKGEYQNDWEIWKKERTKSLTVTNIIETNFKVHGQHNSTLLGKRNSNYVNPGSSKKVKLSESSKDSDDDDSDDDELPLMNNTDGLTVRRLAKIGKGIARYNVIFLPETNESDILRREFDDNEWETLENIFRKKDTDIRLEVPPQLSKVETILNEYDESLEKVTEDNYVDLDAVFFVPSYQGDYKFRKHWLSKWIDNIFQRFLTCFQLSKHVLNDEGSSEYQYRSCGEIENVDRKNQKVLSKSPEERRSTGWYHDGILTININGINFQIGFLEVVGNAIVEDHKKMTSDLQKILKGRDFIFYAMIYYDGAYLVDEIFSFTIPDTPTQLYLLKDIVTDLMSFRARVEHTYTQITNLLKSATSRHHPR
ncbi:hypothetical protein C1645_807963 [Glomus cerebriforme]|uniref:Uncharacterized protein n=1 Tax=Glomus cerebriforme TaxID=658196 RepID=A0A397SN63_9GLOM|nr:hypothetical protein C1645_807963 [Glomus cerebriforme]